MRRIEGAYPVLELAGVVAAPDIILVPVGISGMIMRDVYYVTAWSEFFIHPCFVLQPRVGRVKFAEFTLQPVQLSLLGRVGVRRDIELLHLSCKFFLLRREPLLTGLRRFRHHWL